jgi:hypothetical protein
MRNGTQIGRSFVVWVRANNCCCDDDDDDQGDARCLFPTESRLVSSRLVSSRLVSSLLLLLGRWRQASRQAGRQAGRDNPSDTTSGHVHDTERRVYTHTLSRDYSGTPFLILYLYPAMPSYHVSYIIIHRIIGLHLPTVLVYYCTG